MPSAYLSLACEFQVSEWIAKTAPRDEDRLQHARLGLPPLPDTSVGIARTDWKLETMHGKNVCDPLSLMPRRTLAGGIARGDILLVGTREKVIYLARHCATPTTAKLVKDGWWTVDRVFYGYFEHRQFTVLNVPKAVGFKDSHECHMFAGLGCDVDEARLNGPLAVTAVPCACKHCSAGTFEACELRTTLFGNQHLRRVKVPREQNQLSGLRQLESLHLFAASCKKGQLAASRVPPDEVCLEGLYYLMRLNCNPYFPPTCVYISLHHLFRR